MIYDSERGAEAVRAAYRAFLARWPVPSEQRLLATREGETFVVSCGRAEAPPLLLFHGSGANATMWLADIAPWAEHFRVHAVDMIGEPGLSAPSRPPLDSGRYALWLDDVLRGLGVERARIAGVSLGGWLALDYATRRAGRVEKLALLCPGGVGRQRGAVLWRLPLLFFGDWGRRRLREFVLGARLDAAPAMDGFMALVFRHFRPRRGRLPVFGDEALGRLDMPVLAIVGGRDVLLDSFETRRRLERSAPDARVVLLPEAGHLIRGQTKAVLDFLS